MKIPTLFFAAMLAMAPALAGPGAHGPNGEHLDAPAAAAGVVLPRVETFTEAFELVAQLTKGELSIMIDRYETNEPVLNGVLEVQYQNLKATAKFHADMGDYAVDDPAMLAAIAKPGAHPLLFTLVAGQERAQLKGMLQVAQAGEEDDHDHEHSTWRPWLLAAIAAAVLIVVAVVVRNRKKA